ncbi:MAG: TIGR03545 family protein [Nitrospiraceae bacterium]
MTKWVRWWGVGAFFVVIGAVAVLWFLFIDGIVERMIESQATQVVGAKVELDSADLSLVPAGLTLMRLQVTNPDKPMTNAVDVAHIALGLDGLQLLRRKVIIEEMKVDGVQFGTPRATSGAISTQPEIAPSGEEQPPSGDKDPFSLPTFKVPDVQEIIANEDLETLKLVESLRPELESERQKWEQRLKELPGKEKFEEYQRRVDKLESATQKGGLGGILSGVEEVQTLQQDIERDIDLIKGAKKEFDGQLTALQPRLNQVMKAPQEDLRRLQEKYSLSPQGLANLGQALLGQQVGDWAHQAVAWYKKLQPLLERVKKGQAQDGGGAEVITPTRGIGVNVRFKETQPLPDFLIRLAKVSLNLEAGEIGGKIQNITPDQDVLGAPLMFAFSGEKLSGLDFVKLTGTLNHILPAAAEDTFKLRTRGYQVKDVTLSDRAEWPVALERAKADVTVDAVLRGDAVDAKVNSQLKSVQLSAGQRDDPNPLTRALSSALSGISSLAVETDVTGTLTNYEITLRSDLDRVMQQAAGRMVREQAKELQRKLRSAIAAKVKQPMKDFQGNLGGFNAIGGDLTSRLREGNDVLGGLLQQGLQKEGLPGGLKLPF